MPTISQLIRKPRKRKKKKIKAPALKACPQVRGICDKYLTVAPKKPNSSLKKIVEVTLSNGYKTKAYVIGETGGTPPIQEHNSVLIRGGNTRDLPGLGLKVVRGPLDVAGVSNRKQGRSKYGTKRAKKATS